MCQLFVFMIKNFLADFLVYVLAILFSKHSPTSQYA